MSAYLKTGVQRVKPKLQLFGATALEAVPRHLYIGVMVDATNFSLPFMKMHGLGNDFVVVDDRSGGICLSEPLVRALADRRTGVGFDQLAVMETRHDQLYLRFYNSDGSTSAACGNATRCIAQFVMAETGSRNLQLFTDRGPLFAEQRADGQTSVNMGPPQLAWHEIPLAEEMDTLALPVDGEPSATGMGNPHMTFFVDDVEAIDLATFGPKHEHHPLYPERTNVQIAQIVAPNRIRMRVWERGVGITRASGSSSCAVTVAAARRGFTGRAVTLVLDGGQMEVNWKEDGVWMTGPTAHVFSGTLTQGFLESIA